MGYQVEGKGAVVRRYGEKVGRMQPGGALYHSIQNAQVWEAKEKEVWREVSAYLDGGQVVGGNADADDVWLMSLAPPPNLTQVTHCHTVNIYVSLLEYLVPHHHLLIHLLHVQLRLCSRVLLQKRKGEVYV